MRIAALLLGVLPLVGCFSRPGLSRGDAGEDDATVADGDVVDAPSDGPPGGPFNVVFVTSDARPIGSLLSLANADAWCEQMSAGLPPNTYKAWMSAGTETAPMRLGTAQGFVRPDGLPIANTIAALTSGNHLYPPRLDENGNDVVASDPAIATGTSFMGQLTSNCGNLTNDGASYQFGVSDASAYLWTETAMHACTMNARIYCVGTDHSNALTLQRDPSHRIAFVSSIKMGLGSGVSAFDAECTSEAGAALLPGTFRAAVGLHGQTIKSRFPDGPPWARRDGVVVIPSDMSTVRAPIWLDASSQPLVNLPDSAVVWTGATSFTAASNTTINCNDWGDTNTVDDAITGYAVRSRSAFAIAESTSGCNNQQRVYCLQM